MGEKALRLAEPPLDHQGPVLPRCPRTRDEASLWALQLWDPRAGHRPGAPSSPPPPGRGAQAQLHSGPAGGRGSSLFRWAVGLSQSRTASGEGAWGFGGKGVGVLTLMKGQTLAHRLRPARCEEIQALWLVCEH